MDAPPIHSPAGLVSMAPVLRWCSPATPDPGGGVPHRFGVPRLRGSAVGRGVIERFEINRLHDSGHASPNRLKTGLQTNEETLAAASDSPSTLQPKKGSSNRRWTQMNADGEGDELVDAPNSGSSRRSSSHVWSPAFTRLCCWTRDHRTVGNQPTA